MSRSCYTIFKYYLDYFSEIITLNERLESLEKDLGKANKV